MARERPIRSCYVGCGATSKANVPWYAKGWTCPKCRRAQEAASRAAWMAKEREKERLRLISRQFRQALLGPGAERSRRIAWRTAAHGVVRSAINRGFLYDLKGSGTPCVDCGKPATDWEHRDYAKPLDVDPCCKSCNLRRKTASYPNFFPKQQRIRA